GTLFYRREETMPEVAPHLERPEAMGLAAIYLCGDEGKALSGQHFYSRHLLRDRVNNGVDLYQGDEAFLAQYKGTRATRPATSAPNDVSGASRRNATRSGSTARPRAKPIATP